jgi:hypothetical protein
MSLLSTMIESREQARDAKAALFAHLNAYRDLHRATGHVLQAAWNLAHDNDVYTLDLPENTEVVITYLPMLQPLLDEFGIAVTTTTLVSGPTVEFTRKLS